MLFLNDTTDPAAFLERMHRYAEAGIDHALVIPAVGWDPASLDLVAGALPETEKLTPTHR